MLNLCYVYYLSKLTEFADTVFFVLRKKKTQITWLHLYHHALTPMEAWLLVKFISGEWKFRSLSSSEFHQLNILGGNATFPNILNNFVHVLMYFYYMLAAMGPQYQKFLWWKRYMTELQIVSRSTKAVLNDLTSVNLRVDFKQSSLRLNHIASRVDDLESDLLACSLSFIERSVC